MAVNFIPPEYFGGAGLAAGFGQALGAIQQGQVRREERKEKDYLTKLRELQVAGDIFGKGSEQYAMLARELTGGEAQPLVPFEEQRTRKINEIQKAIDNQTATPDQIAYYNNLHYGNPLGMSAVTRGAQQQLDLGESQVKLGTAQVTEAERSVQINKERDEALAAQGTSAGRLAAMMDINKLEEQKLGMNLTREQIANAQMERRVRDMQLKQIKAEMEAAVQAAQSPFGKQDVEYLSKVAYDMSKAGVLVQPSQLVAGMSGALPEAQQEQFNAIMQDYSDKASELYLATLNEKISEDPNSPAARAAARLKLIYEAERAKRPVKITPEEMTNLHATALGGEITTDGILWWKKNVISFTPERGSLPAAGDAVTLTPEVVDTYFNAAVEQHGTSALNIIEQQRASLNATTPGLGDALYERAKNFVPPEAQEKLRAKPATTPAPAATQRDSRLERTVNRIGELRKERERVDDLFNRRLMELDASNVSNKESVRRRIIANQTSALRKLDQQIGSLEAGLSQIKEYER